MGGGVDVKFGKFDGRERATKIEQVRTREEFWSLGDNVTKLNTKGQVPIMLLYWQ